MTVWLNNYLAENIKFWKYLMTKMNQVQQSFIATCDRMETLLSHQVSYFNIKIWYSLFKILNTV